MWATTAHTSPQIFAFLSQFAKLINRARKNMAISICGSRVIFIFDFNLHTKPHSIAFRIISHTTKKNCEESWQIWDEISVFEQERFNGIDYFCSTLCAVFSRTSFCWLNSVIVHGLSPCRTSVHYPFRDDFIIQLPY